MNVLEHYIQEIKSVEPYEADWTKEFPDRKFVKVVVVTNCYGHVEEHDTIENVEDWEKAKEQGYFMW